MAKVINQWGLELDFDQAVELMDFEIRERIHSEFSPCSEQEFFVLYSMAHLMKYGDYWVVDDIRPEY